MTPWEPIPETVEAVTALDLAGEGDLLARLLRLANRAQKIVPDLIGISLARLDENITFTLVATAEEIAVLDAIQYAAGGPCVEGAHTAEVQACDDNDLLSEERWQLFAEAAAAHTVRSTLTLPIFSGQRVTGSVNLYAASRQAFVGHHDQLAVIFGGWASGAVANADLSFTTRNEARATPERVRDLTVIEVASCVLAAQLGVSVDVGRATLRDAAARAGVSAADLAREIVDSHGKRDAGE
jgi:GAF domain-containing protein